MPGAYAPSRHSRNRDSPFRSPLKGPRGYFERGEQGSAGGLPGDSAAGKRETCKGVLTQRLGRVSDFRSGQVRSGQGLGLQVEGRWPLAWSPRFRFGQERKRGSGASGLLRGPGISASCRGSVCLTQAARGSDLSAQTFPPGPGASASNLLCTALTTTRQRQPEQRQVPAAFRKVARICT
jgi:hypothetical protein